jgi:hypothetical protein
MNKLKNIILAAVIAFGFVAVALPATAGAVNVSKDCSTLGADAQNSAICKGGDDQIDGVVKTIVNTLLFILGAISVVVIIIAGIMYTVSGGNSNNVTRAKDMLLYAVIGLVVAVLAYAIVNFVVGLF